MRWPGAASIDGGGVCSQTLPNVRGQRCAKQQPRVERSLAPASRRARIRVPCGQRRVGRGNRREQRLGIGMIGRREDGIGRPFLADDARVHHGDPVRDVHDHRQVVRDEEVGSRACRADPQAD